MLIPLRHENMQGRRWPVISIALIAINIVAFLATHGQIQAQATKQSETRVRILMLAAMHRELNMNPETQQFVTNFRDKNPAVWSKVASQTRQPEDAWEARMRMSESPLALQQEMDSLQQRFADLEHDSIVAHYAFIPAHPQPIAYLTANFLHGGWLHIIGNMWFLWLSGAIFGGSSGGVAHWAHVGGFVFGAIGAVGLGYSGLEHVANQAIEAKVAWTADPALVQATEKVAQG